MSLKIKQFSQTLFKHHPPGQYEDIGHMHREMDKIPGHLKALMLELLERPMTRDELQETMQRLEMRF